MTRDHQYRCVSIGAMPIVYATVGEYIDFKSSKRLWPVPGSPRGVFGGGKALQTTFVKKKCIRFFIFHCSKDKMSRIQSCLQSLVAACYSESPVCDRDSSALQSIAKSLFHTTLSRRIRGVAKKSKRHMKGVLYVRHF